MKRLFFSLVCLLFSSLFLFAVDTDGDGSGEEWTIVTVEGVEMEWDGYRVKESESDLDPYSTSFDDIGEGRFFQSSYPVEKETYTINQGNLGESEVVHIKGSAPGPVIYIVAGVHGDEKAAWYAGIMLESVTISSGDLYILSPANAPGAEKRRRYFFASQDLNRNFPGREDGNKAEKMAYAIYCDIERVKPSLVLDLHEAILYTSERDFLGSTYIFSNLDGMEDLFFSLLWATEDGEICHNDFGYNGPGPKGSINRSVTDGLGIPTITVETFRGFDIRRRVYDQLDTVQYILQWHGMV
ncbi:MAG: succinylglutamate desuccinylase/aspartoacylase family protein [Candidatus Ornithospirochaeta sp.]